jgi:hypothetical protein
MSRATGHSNDGVVRFAFVVRDWYAICPTQISAQQLGKPANAWAMKPPRAQTTTLQTLSARPFSALRIADERAFRRLPLYPKLRNRLVADNYQVRVLPKTTTARWDQAVLLNLTFWGANTLGSEPIGDVLETASVPADVVCHMAWHHVARAALPASEQRTPSAAALFLGESIASAFDVYLVGELLKRGQPSQFLDTQVARMAETAQSAGSTKREFQALLQMLTQAPRMAFADLRELLFDTTLALYAATEIDAAYGVLQLASEHPLGALLPRFELSNWVLYARAYARRVTGKRARAVDAVLRDVECPLTYLEDTWLTA